jgi:hypothetical protein
MAVLPHDEMIRVPVMLLMRKVEEQIPLLAFW